MTTALTPSELLAHNEEETARWYAWFNQHTDALSLKVGLAMNEDVRGVLLHIFAVELRYSERLLEKTDQTAYESLPTGSVDELFGIGEKARDNLRQFVGRAADADWNKTITFQTLSAGTLSASKRKCFVHALLHSMRHWAQLATALRERGLKQDWGHDFLFTKAMQ